MMDIGVAHVARTERKSVRAGAEQIELLDEGRS